MEILPAVVFASMISFLLGLLIGHRVGFSRGYDIVKNIVNIKKFSATFPKDKKFEITNVGWREVK